MSCEIATLEQLVSRLPPGRARRRYEAVLVEAIQRVPHSTGELPSKTRNAMLDEFKRFVRLAAETYERLSPADRKEFLVSLGGLQDRADQACREENWAKFQAVLVEAKALLAEVQPGDLPALAQTHWVYRAWSRVLDAEVWWVCCEQEVGQLAQEGIPRGSIYTEAELVELLRLPQRPGAEALKSLHAVKSYFDATVVPMDIHGDTRPA